MIIETNYTESTKSRFYIMIDCVHKLNMFIINNTAENDILMMDYKMIDCNDDGLQNY